MSTSLVIAIVSVMVLTVVVPIAIMLYLKKRGGRWFHFAIGAATFIVSALVLEQLLHTAVLLSPLGTALQSSIWLYALYGGLAAGIFEETGRFIAFRAAVKRESRPLASLSYGAGHGGIEAFLITGMTMFNNLILLLAAGSGAALPAEVQAVVETLQTTPASMFLWAGVERLAAIAVHMANSVLVFAAVRLPGRRWLYPAAILTHALVNFAAVTVNAHLGAAAAELVTLALAVLLVLLAAGVYGKMEKFSQTS